MRKFRLYSIRYKLALAVGSFFVLFILIFLISSRFYLEDFYIAKIKPGMNNSGYLIRTSDDVMSDFPISDNRQLLNLLRDQNQETGYRYEIIDSNSNILLSSIHEFSQYDEFEFPPNVQTYLTERLNNVDEMGSNFVVFKTPEDNQGLVMLVLPLPNLYYLVITEQLGRIQGNVAIANQFFLLIGISLTILGVMVTYLISRRITDPIISISQQAKEIAAFDFTTRYEGATLDEIGQLGQYMNHISGELEERIVNLNTMNLRLKDDMTLQRRFLASISHEFKSPAGIIKGYAESIKLNYYQNDTEKNRLVDRILDSADQMTALVEDIIMLSTLDNRDFQLHKEEICLSEILDNVCRGMEEKYSDTSLCLEMEIQDHIMFNGDQMRMTQIFNNLLENGFRYTTDPWYFGLSMVQNHEGIHLRFTNSCHTIDPKDLDQIFTPFYRFEKSHNKKTGGHGLGLSIVKALVNAHGGIITASYADHQFSMDLLL